jgi:hypothetical protein
MHLSSRSLPSLAALLLVFLIGALASPAGAAVDYYLTLTKANGTAIVEGIKISSFDYGVSNGVTATIHQSTSATVSVSELVRNHPHSTLTIKRVSDTGATLFIHLSQPEVTGISWSYKDGKPISEIITVMYQKISVTY